MNDTLLAAPTTAVLTTLSPDGSPQSSPVWFLHDGGEVLVSTTEDRAKTRNVRRDPRVAFTVFDSKNPLHYVSFHGSAIVEDDPTADLRDRIARKHGFSDGAAFDPPGTRRIVLRLIPKHVVER